MAPQPQRRTDAQRKTHLDASVVPVERALLHRAAHLEEMAKAAATQADGSDRILAHVAEFMAAEFRTLAEELHYW